MLLTDTLYLYVITLRDGKHEKKLYIYIYIYICVCVCVFVCVCVCVCTVKIKKNILKKLSHYLTSLFHLQ